LRDFVEAALWLQRAEQGGIEPAGRYLKRALERMDPQQRAHFAHHAEQQRAA
jgi:hypothetical protein